jgi:hypothetical protein
MAINSPRRSEKHTQISNSRDLTCYQSSRRENPVSLPPPPPQVARTSTLVRCFLHRVPVFPPMDMQDRKTPPIQKEQTSPLRTQLTPPRLYRFYSLLSVYRLGERIAKWPSHCQSTQIMKPLVYFLRMLVGPSLIPHRTLNSISLAMF